MLIKNKSVLSVTPDLVLQKIAELIQKQMKINSISIDTLTLIFKSNKPEMESIIQELVDIGKVKIVPHSRYTKQCKRDEAVILL